MICHFELRIFNPQRVSKPFENLVKILHRHPSKESNQSVPLEIKKKSLDTLVLVPLGVSDIQRQTAEIFPSTSRACVTSTYLLPAVHNLSICLPTHLPTQSNISAAAAASMQANVVHNSYGLTEL